MDLPLSKLSNHAPVTSPVQVLHGAQPGVMQQMEMLYSSDELQACASTARHVPVHINTSSLLRAPEGGVFRTTKRIGDGVSLGELVGHVANPYEDTAVEVRSSHRGIIIGRTTLPIVNMGDALMNIGWSEDVGERASPERLAEPVWIEDEDLQD